MLNMLNHVESPLRKNASFSCHVEYVEYVECFGNYEGPFDFGRGGQKMAISNNFSGISECPVQKVLLSAVMLNMLNHVESC